MHFEQRERARQALGESGIRQAILANASTVKWLTGFAAPTELGPHPFAGGPPIVVFQKDTFSLVLVDAFASAFEPDPADHDLRLIGYQGYNFEAPVEGHRHLHETVAELLEQGPTAVETHDLPAYLLPSGDVVPIDDWALPLRMVKTGEELEKLRKNFSLSDVGQAAARQAVGAGVREIDIFIAASMAIHRAAGARVPIGNDFVAGSRTNNVGGWPTGTVIREGDSFIADISTVLDGYWSDSCGTYYAGPPSDRQRAMHEAVGRALELGAQKLRPGALAREVDRAMRSAIEQAGFPVFPHHGGHGVGVSGHEAPRIVPYSEAVLQAGMVVMLEPGIYFPGETSVRLEDAFLIQEGPAIQLTNHDKSF